VYWLSTVIFLAHIAEEFPRFPAWATRHFGATSRAWYVYSHVALVAIAVIISAHAEATAPRTAWPMLSAAFQWALATNALFHITTSVLFREYSPGLISGALLSLPGTLYLFSHALAAQLLTRPQLAMALGLGTVACAAAVGSLWLRMDFDWRLRRPPRATSAGPPGAA
jgi:Protein of unknown function with HXXEE motif